VVLKSRPAAPTVNEFAGTSAALTGDEVVDANRGAAAAGRASEAVGPPNGASLAAEAANNRAAHVLTATRVGAKRLAKIVRGAIAVTETTVPGAMTVGKQRGQTENPTERPRTKSASSNRHRLSCKIPDCKPRKAGWSWKKNPPTLISATSKTRRARRVMQKGRRHRADVAVAAAAAA
jgi:hypothetical protein